MSKNFFSYILIGCLAYSLFFLGCASTSNNEEKPNNEVAQQEEVKEQQQPTTVAQNNEQEEGQGQQEVTENSPSVSVDASPDVSSDALKSFEEKVAQENFLEEQGQFLLDSYLKTANNYANQGKYEDAYHFVLQALEIHPDNPQALNLKNQYGQKLNIRPEEIETQLAEAEDYTKVKTEQALTEINNRVAQGKRHASQGDYDKAIPLFQQAKELLRWMPYHVGDLKGKSRQIEFLIEQAEAKRDKKREVMERERLARAEEEAKRQEEARIRTIQEKVDTMFRQANIAFEQERFELAESFCNRITALQPQNQDAQDLKKIIVEARHAKAADVQRDTYMEQWKTIFEEIDRRNIPQTKEIVKFPSYEEWKKINSRGSRDIKEEEAEDDPATRTTKEKLSSEVLSMDFTEAPLREVVDFIRTTTDLNIIIDPEVEKEFPEEETLKVDLTVSKLKLESILDLILSLKGLAYRIDEGVVIISTKKRVTENPTLRLYNVRDLTGKLIDFPAPEINLFETTDGDDNRGVVLEENEEESAGNISEEQLTELIKNNIAKNTWEDENNSIDIRGGTLIVRQTKPVHNQIDLLLKDLRKSTGLLVTIESRFITVTDDFLEDVGVDWRGLGVTAGGVADGQPEADFLVDAEDANDDDGIADNVGVSPNARFIDDFVFTNPQQNNPSVGTDTSAGAFFSDDNIDVRNRIENLFDQTLGEDNVITNTGGLSLQLAYLDDVELQTILRAVRKRQRSNIVTAPRLTVFNTQRANVSVVTQKAFVQDFEVEVATNAVIADPVIGTVQEGVVLDVRPIISADRKYITLELQPTVAVENDIIDLDINLASSEQADNDNQLVTIQLPDLQMTRIKTTVTIPDGGTLLIGGVFENSQQRFESGVPVLSDLPIISFLTTRKGTFNRKRALLIIITAKITSMEEEEPKEGFNE